MGLKLVTAPTIYPVSLAEAKAHVRQVDDDDDAILEICIKAATGYVDGPTGFLGEALIDQTWNLFLDAFPVAAIKISLPPLIEIVGVFYVDGDGNEQELSVDNYVVDSASDFPWVAPVDSWPSTMVTMNAVRVQFRSGYVDTGNSPATGEVPWEVKAAILLHIGSLYEHRETVVIGQTAAQLPWGAEQLLRNRRKHIGMA